VSFFSRAKLVVYRADKELTLLGSSAAQRRSTKAARRSNKEDEDLFFRFSSPQLHLNSFTSSHIKSKALHLSNGNEHETRPLLLPSSDLDNNGDGDPHPKLPPSLRLPE
jgi:hypothetical protein